MHPWRLHPKAQEINAPLALATLGDPCTPSDCTQSPGDPCTPGTCYTRRATHPWRLHPFVSISPHPPAVIAPPNYHTNTLVSPHPSSFFNSIFTPLHILSATISIFFHSIFFSLVTIKSIASSISSCLSEVAVSLAQCRVLKQHVCVSRAPCTTTKETRRLAPSHARTISSQLQWLFGFLSVS